MGQFCGEHERNSEESASVHLRVAIQGVQYGDQKLYYNGLVDPWHGKWLHPIAIWLGEHVNRLLSVLPFRGRQRISSYGACFLRPNTRHGLR